MLTIKTNALNNHKSLSEFNEHIKSINLLNSLVEDGQNKTRNLISIKIKSDDLTLASECIFKIMTKDKIWLKVFKYEEFNDFKSEMGFDGNWKIFFKTLEQAINKVDGGNISIKTLQQTEKGSKTKDKKEKLLLTVLHPITPELKIKSEILFENFISIDSKEFSDLNLEFMFDLYESKQVLANKEREKIMENLNKNGMSNVGTNIANNITGSINNSGTKLEVKKNLKRKYQASLINPNAKKGKTKGVKFINVEEKEENLSEKSNEDN